jgi:pyruvate dehydrogenase E2 component (dihydrolipoamide acetyltransferase)
MAVSVKMPKIGPSMTEGTIIRWLKNVGDAVAEGEALVRIETDTSEEDVRAEAAGCLLAIDADPEQMVPCGDVIARIGARGETV